jgi:hypothetical protein
MTAPQLKTALEKLGLTVGTMHVSVGNIYQCQQLSEYDWMYENQFIERAKEYITEQEMKERYLTQ